MKHSELKIVDTTRYVWLDWMKALAIYFIIVGHCWAPGSKYVYAFSVPVFYLISGFLSKKELVKEEFWRKIFWNLVVPMVMFYVINTLFLFSLQYIRGEFCLSHLWENPLMAIVGNQGHGLSSGGIGNMWFVYTLILCKIVLQYLPSRNDIYAVVISVVCLCAAFLLRYYQLEYYNSFVNILLAWPFFALGNFLRQYKGTISQMTNFENTFLLLIGVLLVTFSCKFNDIVLLYRCSYGGDLFLFGAGAVGGSFFLYGISRLLERFLMEQASILGGAHL